MNWIKVTEQTPNEGQIVLAYQDNRRAPEFSMLVLMYRYNRFFNIPNIVGEIDYDDFPLITHWMPLPEKP